MTGALTKRGNSNTEKHTQEDSHVKTRDRAGAASM